MWGNSSCGGETEEREKGHKSSEFRPCGMSVCSVLIL